MALIRATGYRVAFIELINDLPIGSRLRPREHLKYQLKNFADSMMHADVDNGPDWNFTQLQGNC